ncbi:putative NUP-1 protein [Trypanosoma cruzi]|uniref:Putative NUP-1 protein n=1 Tax=Trypanosoma cruzi TaxID=5693 RepID=A0A2V2WDL4_TRYCR|nr:putative NUP-1 protein [Trypanosoma cruzi]
MFNANDARRYPGFFTRKWTPPPDGFSLRNARSRRSGGATFAHATPPPLTPRLATPIGVRGLAATDNLGRLGLSQALPEDVSGSRALVGMSREEPDISPHISTLDVSGSGRFTSTHASRHGWEDMPQGERMNYAARLEDDVAQMQNALDRAYHLRDHYKEEAARVKNELMQKQRALDCLERDHRQCGEVICRHEREAVDLRHRLDCAEGEVQRLKYLQRSEDPNVRVPLLDAQRELRLKQTEVDSLLEEKRQLEEHVRRLTLGHSGEHYAARVQEGAVPRPPNVAHVEEGGEELTRAQHVIQVLCTELQDMRQQLQNERCRNEGTLDEAIQQRNGLQGVNTSLREELEGLKEMCCSQNRTIDELRDTLLQRAPVTHHEHYALVRRCEKLKEEIERCQTRGGDSVNKAHELEKQAIQQQLLVLRADGEETNTLLLKTRADVADMREYISTLEKELDLTRKAKTLLEEELTAAKEKLQYATEQSKEAEQVIVNFNRRLQDQFSTIQVQKAQLDLLQQEATRASVAITPSKAAPVDSRPEGGNGDKETKNGMPPETPGVAETTMATQHKEAQAVRETVQAVPEENVKSQVEDRGKTHKTEGELPQFPQQLSAAHAAIDQLSAERSAQAERVAELTAAVARLESSADAPERVVEALSAELRETQDRLRQAEEEASQLAQRIGSSEGLRESAVATRSAETSLAVRLSSALKALEQLAEERETLARGSAELEERVRELEHELRDAENSLCVKESELLKLGEECSANSALLSNALAAVDQVVQEHASAETSFEEQTSSLVKTFEVLHGQFLLTKKGFEEQWERRAEACTAELLAARRSAQRANEARKRAEENAAICMRKVEEVNAELMKAQRDYRALERLLRSSGRLSISRVENNDGEEHEREMSFTPTFLRNTEGAELAQFLQISSLQADLMLSRSTCHRLEARQLELQTALEQSEWRLASLPPGVEESHAELLRVRGQLENHQLEYHRLEGRYKALKRQQAEELAQAFNLLETQMQALREEVEGGQPRGRQARRPGRCQGVEETTEAEGKMLRGRITFLEHTLRQKETEMHRLQEELGRNEAQLDQFEDQVTVATQRLENTARRSTHLEQKVHELKRTNQELREELGAVRARVVVQAERRSPQRAPSTDVLREALHGGRASSLASTPTQGEREGRAASALPRAAAKRPRAIDASS